MWYDKYLKDIPSIRGTNFVYWLNERQQFHRLDGPAVIYRNGSQEWWKNGELHREDGPAIFDAINIPRKFYCYIEGRCITEQVELWIKENNYPDYKEWDDAIKMHFKLSFVK